MGRISTKVLAMCLRRSTTLGNGPPTLGKGPPGPLGTLGKGPSTLGKGPPTLGHWGTFCRTRRLDNRDGGNRYQKDGRLYALLGCACYVPVSRLIRFDQETSSRR
jgi:hypothetical protein